MTRAARTPTQAMASVRVRAVVDTSSNGALPYYMPENSLVFIHNENSTVHILDDNTTATLATAFPVNTSDYTCIGVSITAVSTALPTFGARMCTYKAFGPHTLQLPNPNCHIGGRLYWSVIDNVVSLTTGGEPGQFVGILMEIISADSIRIMFSPPL